MRADGWNKSDDRTLLAAIKAEGGIRAAARALGISENAAIARHNRIRGKRFASDIKRNEAKRARAQARRLQEKQALSVMRDMLRGGAERDAAICAARIAGARLQEIANEFGLSRERIRQIAEAIA